MIYTGTTGFRHTDGINNGRPVIQSKLQDLGYTVDWEDCSGSAPGPANGTATRRRRTAASLRRQSGSLRRDRVLEHVLVVDGDDPGPLLEEAQKER